MNILDFIGYLCVFKKYLFCYVYKEILFDVNIRFFFRMEY